VVIKRLIVVINTK